MLTKRFAFLLSLMLLCSHASAEITLKHGFFTGWKYSLDGDRYEKVGFSGSKLFLEMEGNDEAQEHMKKYKSAKVWAAVTGTPGGFLIGWPLGGYIGSGGEWQEGYTTMLLIGAPLSVISLILEGSASRNLKKAVGLYNASDPSLGFMLDYKRSEMDGSGALLVGLKYRF